MDKRKWFDIIKTVAPIVLMMIPGMAPLVPLVIFGITEAEQIRGASGPQKKQHVMEIVQAGLTGTNAVAKKELLPPQQTMQTVSAAIDTVVGVANLIDRVHAVESGPGVESLRPATSTGF